ncbi:MAG: undecaprenyl/decaprenyl-phosphate alpha-N-acetylglucosaminyl 1-phosphate transferase [Bacteroidales bacterium]|nr:undecaprenyl/decaprenyl-phosphate alpha-N-acetylglucosaminyl 1-phosphate transferase [Bacteroidales bacterium]
MDFSILWYIPVFLVSLSFVAVVIPAIVRTASRINLYDSQDERKVHHGDIPRLGGISFLPAILFTLLTVIAVMTRFLPSEFQVTYRPITELMMTAAGCVLLYLTGIMDDVIGVTYRSKFVIQVIAASLICSTGLFITDLNGIFGIHRIPVFIGVPLTITVIVLVINSINLIDGIDGLASGLCILGGVGYALMFNRLAMSMNLVLAASMLGVMVMFYIYNTLGKPGISKIFMGDTGSLTMGYILAFFAVKLCCFNDFRPTETIVSEELFVYSISVILVPVLDVFRVFFARIMDGKSPFHADKRHIHHKFLALGFTMRQARWTIFGISLTFWIMNVIMSLMLHWNINVVIAIDILLWVVMNVALSSRVRDLREENDAVAGAYSDVGRKKKWNFRK